MTRALTRRAAAAALALLPAALAGLFGLRAVAAGAAADLRPKRCPTNDCGYLYDPALGDPEAGIPPGTAFEDLPEDWRCPVCARLKARW